MGAPVEIGVTVSNLTDWRRLSGDFSARLWAEAAALRTAPYVSPSDFGIRLTAPNAGLSAVIAPTPAAAVFYMRGEAALSATGALSARAAAFRLSTAGALSQTLRLAPFDSLSAHGFARLTAEDALLDVQPLTLAYFDGFSLGELDGRKI
jgi:hypothetical protein